jgi:hypothetical protein
MVDFIDSKPTYRGSSELERQLLTWEANCKSLQVEKKRHKSADCDDCRNKQALKNLSIQMAAERSEASVGVKGKMRAVISVENEDSDFERSEGSIDSIEGQVGGDDDDDVQIAGSKGSVYSMGRPVSNGDKEDEEDDDDTIYSKDFRDRLRAKHGEGNSAIQEEDDEEMGDEDDSAWAQSFMAEFIVRCQKLPEEVGGDGGKEMETSMTRDMQRR